MAARKMGTGSRYLHKDLRRLLLVQDRHKEKGLGIPSHDAVVRAKNENVAMAIVHSSVLSGTSEMGMSIHSARIEGAVMTRVHQRAAGAEQEPAQEALSYSDCLLSTSFWLV